MTLKSFTRRNPAALWLTAAVAGLSQVAQADPAVRLAGHVPQAALARAHVLGRVSPGEPLRLALTLPLRDPQGLETLLRRQATPGDPLFQQFISPAEFADRFGPSADDYARVAEFAKRSGLSIVGTQPSRLLLDVTGTATRVEAAFGTRLLRYQARDGRVFRATQSDPSVPAEMQGRLAGVVGLNTTAVRRTHLQEKPEETLRPSLAPRDGTGPRGGLSPADLVNAYGLAGNPAVGTGQTLALFELDGYAPSDIAAYESAFGLPPAALQNVLVDGATGTPGVSADECTLDIELALAGAPGLSKILVYEAPNDGLDATVLDLYSRIANDNVARQVATSWGAPEDQTDRATLNAENAIFQQMAAQGQSVFGAGGDNGAYDDGSTLSVDDPASQPFVTGVGGTSLTLGLGGGGAAYAGETAWSDPTDISLSPRGSGTGGGISKVWPAPPYQSGLISSSAGRSVPDVALDSDPNTGFSIYVGGGWHVYGGTSAAVPIWAAFTARVNGARAAQGQGPLGFFNPPIYAIGASPSYSTDFHDITTGNNLYAPATAGYDQATGWGSFQGGALLNTLVTGLPAAQMATVSGTVTAADTGAPIAGAAVLANSTAGGLALVSGATDAGGNYTLTIPTGVPLSVIVSAYGASGGHYAGAQAMVGQAAPGQAVIQPFALNPAVTFAPGLQMISSPYDYSGLHGFPASGGDFTALFGEAGVGEGAPFLQWQPTMGGYVFYPHAPVSTLRPGQGYWTSLPAGSYLHFDGALVPRTAFPIPLAAGWNQIGDPFPAAAPIGALADGVGTPLASSASITLPLYRFDTASRTYVAVSGTDALQPYVGYWVYARTATTLNVSPP